MNEPTRATSQPEQPPEGDASAPTLAPPSPAWLAAPATLAPAADPAFAEPSIVPGYEILNELGRGGMGVVYRARQIGLNRIVALKMILAGVHATTDTLARFRTEAEAVARLQHPHIVQIHEIGEQQGLPYFSMEYVAGGSLADQLAGTPVPARDAAKLVEILARAIHYAHQHGIVHRDLKPANILLVGGGGVGGEPSKNRSADDPPRTTPHASLTPKITDFGLAKQLDSEQGQTRSGAILGTPSYMAPEQAGGSVRRESSGNTPTVGPAADVYALGAILYEMLIGRPPFKASTPLDTILQVVSEEPVPPCRLQPKVPRDLETICLKCLEKDPQRRYGSAEAFADDLQRFLADEPILARPTSRWERTAKWVKRRPALAALLVLGITAPLALAAVSLAFQASLQRANSKLRLALADVETERDHATQAKKDVEREHRRAQAHLEKALEAVNRMLKRVGDEQLANVPQFADLRRQVLEEALDFYRAFLKQEGDEPALRREMARAYDRTTEVYFMLSKNTEAENACKEAIALLERLVAEAGRADDQLDLSRSYSYLGHVYSTTARFPQSLTAYAKSLALAEGIVQQHPENLEYIAWLVQCYCTQGYSFAQTNPKQGEHYFRRAGTLAEKMLAARPQSEELQCKLAEVYTNLGKVLLAQKRMPEAGAMLHKSAQLLQPSDPGPPRTSRDYRATLAMYQVQQGLFFLRSGTSSEAVPHLEAGVAGHEQLLRETPKMVPYRYELTVTYPVLADLYLQSKQPDRALKAWQRAIELAEGLVNDYPTFALFMGPQADHLRARCLLIRVRQGEAKEILAAAKSLEAKKELLPETIYDLTRVYALAAASPQIDKSAAEECVHSALALLTRLEGSAYFRTEARIAQARKDEDLQSLHEHGEFKKLLEKAEKRISSAPAPAQP